MKKATEPGVYSALVTEHPIHKHIGLIVTQFSTLEAKLDFIIWQMSEAHSFPTSKILTSQVMGLAPRFKIIIALARKNGFSAADIKRINSLMGDCANVNEERNRLIHDPWYTDKKTKGAFRDRAINHKGEDYGKCRIETDELERFSVKIIQKIKAVNSLQQLLLPKMKAHIEARDRRIAAVRARPAPSKN